MRKFFYIFGAVLSGTILFWVIVFTGYEIWINSQPETYEYGTIDCDPETHKQRILWSEKKTLINDRSQTRQPALTETEYIKQYLKGVKEFGPLKIGGRAPFGKGDKAIFDNKLVPGSNFYIYAQRRGLSVCEFDNCAIVEGKVVECMGGWLSGDGHPEVSDLVGLDSLEVSQGKASIVVISDNDSKIIGIYPNHTESDILSILYQYPEYRTSLQYCTEKIYKLLN